MSSTLIKTVDRAGARNGASIALLVGCLLAFADRAGAARPEVSETARIRAFESSLRPVVDIEGQPQQRWTLAERMEYWKVPGVSIAVIRNGKIAWARGYGVIQVGKPEKVDAQTMFSVGSVSKVGAAAITLRLVDAGQLDLDRNVNSYLKRWQVPGNGYTAIRPVTLRGILSHTAGLTLHGFPDFQPGDPLPTVIDTLEGRPPAKTEPVRVVLTPGERFKYSGGGTTLEQLVIEEVTGLEFADAARRYVFEPLGMARSTYENPLPQSYPNVAKAHGEDGRPRALPRGYETMPEMAASGLWTTPSDYARLIIAFIQSYRGAGNFLQVGTAHQMMTEAGHTPAGLGPFLEGEGMARRFSHGGANDSYRAWMEGHLGTGNGLVILTNGANGTKIHMEVRRAVAAAEGWSAELEGCTSVPAIKLSASELADKEGTYAVSASSSILGYRTVLSAVSYRVFQKNGELYMAENGREEGNRLVPADASRFIIDANPVIGTVVPSVEFVRDYSGHVSSLVIRGAADYAVEAKKVAAQ